MTAPRFSADTTTAVVRYQVRDVDRAVEFYTRHLGFELEQRPGPVLAIVSRGHLHLLLSGPGASGSRPMPDGRQQETRDLAHTAWGYLSRLTTIMLA